MQSAYSIHCSLMKFALVLVLLVAVILSALVILVSAAQLLALAPPAAVPGRGAFVQKRRKSVGSWE